MHTLKVNALLLSSSRSSHGLKNTTTKASNKEHTKQNKHTNSNYTKILGKKVTTNDFNFKGILLQIQVYVINIRTDRGPSKNAFFFYNISPTIFL